MLRLPSNISRARKLRRVREVLVDLGLAKCQDTTIGVPGLIKVRFVHCSEDTYETLGYLRRRKETSGVCVGSANESIITLLRRTNDWP